MRFFIREDQYWSNLTWARLGTLPFLVLLCVVTFLWARRWFCEGFSEAAGFWAVLLLVCTSPILGHAGLATNDVACAAGAALALYQFLRWLEQPRDRAMSMVGLCDRIRGLVQVFEHPVPGGVLCGGSPGHDARSFQTPICANRSRGMRSLCAGVGHVPVQPHSAGDVLRTTPSRDRQHVEQPAAADIVRGIPS